MVQIHRHQRGYERGIFTTALLLVIGFHFLCVEHSFADSTSPHSITILKKRHGNRFGVPDKNDQVDSSYVSGVDYSMPVAAHEIKFMHYNVENLFDTQHDEGKDDYEFLPSSDSHKSECAKNPVERYRRQCQQTDWNENHLTVKLNQIKRVVEAQGVLPDLMSVVEVENEHVVRQLADVLGFQKVLVTNGLDQRGVDVGLMFNENKLELESSREIELHYKSQDFESKPTRNILAAYFRIRGSRTAARLAVYVNHWPSQAAPSMKRFETALQLKQAMAEDMARIGRENLTVVAVGDFNTINADNPHPLRGVLEDSKWSDALTDVQDLYNREGCAADPDQMCKKMPRGSYYFGRDNAWNDLDIFFVSQNALTSNSALRLMPETFRIIAADFMVNRRNDIQNSSGSTFRGTPKRYNHNSDDLNTAGFSDHFPIEMKLSFQ